MTNCDILYEKIRLAFPGSEYIKVDDPRRDDCHLELILVSKDFEGLAPVQRHRLINKALDGFLGNQLHALSIKAYASKIDMKTQD